MKALAARRDTLRWALVSAVWPLSAAGFLPSVLAMDRQLPVPSGPMTLVRMLERGLGEGEVLRVTRSWRVDFTQTDEGMRIDGQQVSVAVDAPAKLAGIAELERRRVETNVLPLRLDRAGLIVGAPTPRVSEELDAAVAQAAELIGRDLGEANVRNVALHQLSGLQQAAGRLISRVPHDLIYPQSLAWAEERAMPLPDGSHGAMIVRFNAELQDCCLLLKQSTRTVETRIGNSTRASREGWSLQPA